MNDARAPTNAQRKQILDAYQKGKKPKELSEKTGISINTIKSWIKRSKVKEIETVKGAPPKKEGAPPKKSKGAPVGNKNAVGHGAPQRNTNAEKHGAYSQLYWDSLDKSETDLLSCIPVSEEFQLQQQVNMYTIRERRLMHKISEIHDKSTNSKGLYIKGVKKKKRVCVDDKGDKKEVFEDTSTETEYSLKALMTLEAELTKVQRAKNKSIDSLIRLRIEKEKYDDLMLGHNSKILNIAEDDNEDDEGVIIYLPSNGRD